MHLEFSIGGLSLWKESHSLDESRIFLEKVRNGIIAFRNVPLFFRLDSTFDRPCEHTGRLWRRRLYNQRPPRTAASGYAMRYRINE